MAGVWALKESEWRQAGEALGESEWWQAGELSGRVVVSGRQVAGALGESGEGRHLAAGMSA